MRVIDSAGLTISELVRDNYLIQNYNFFSAASGAPLETQAESLTELSIGNSSGGEAAPKKMNDQFWGHLKNFIGGIFFVRNKFFWYKSSKTNVEDP